MKSGVPELKFSPIFDRETPGGNAPCWRALAVIVACCALVCLLLLVETETAWGRWPFHLATALTQMVICFVAWRSVRVWRRRNAQTSDSSAELHDMRQAKETAESVNLAKSRYLANVSHEIRSPLNAIYGYAQLVESDYGVDAHEAAGVIRRCAEQMSTLIEGLLDISQVEHGVLRLNTSVVRLEPFISQLLGMVRPAATAKGLALDYVCEGRLPEFVRMDHGRLRQVLVNLLNNAIKFTDYGTITLSLRYVGQIATFEVRDTGPGIRPEDRATIFERFQRGGSDEIRSRPGAGLGLSISRAITGILGGQLELVDSPARGAIFRVTLMLGEVTGLMREQQSQRRVLGYQGPRHTVLVVDDDGNQRDFVTCLLRSLDFEVCEAADGETALTLAATRDFDLAILDITLPGLSGWEVATRLRARPASQSGPQRNPLQILMLSANSGEMHGPEFRSQLHDHFLIKPVEFETLTDAIGGLLNLSWVKELAQDDAAGAAATGPDNATCEALSQQGREHARNLRELLRIGYARGMEEEIRKLQAEAPELARLLFACLDRFDLAAMARILEGSLNETALPQ